MWKKHETAPVEEDLLRLREELRETLERVKGNDHLHLSHIAKRIVQELGVTKLEVTDRNGSGLIYCKEDNG